MITSKCSGRLLEGFQQDNMIKFLSKNDAIFDAVKTRRTQGEQSRGFLPRDDVRIEEFFFKKEKSPGKN